MPSRQHFPVLLTQAPRKAVAHLLPDLADPFNPEAFDATKATKRMHRPLTGSASARVLEKCGFEEEGFLRKHFLKDGQFLDARLFGLLRGVDKRRRNGMGI